MSSAVLGTMGQSPGLENHTLATSLAIALATQVMVIGFLFPGTSRLEPSREVFQTTAVVPTFEVPRPVSGPPAFPGVGQQWTAPAAVHLNLNASRERVARVHSADETRTVQTDLPAVARVPNHAPRRVPHPTEPTSRTEPAAHTYPARRVPHELEPAPRSDAAARRTRSRLLHREFGPPFGTATPAVDLPARRGSGLVKTAASLRDLPLNRAFGSHAGSEARPFDGWALHPEIGSLAALSSDAYSEARGVPAVSHPTHSVGRPGSSLDEPRRGASFRHRVDGTGDWLDAQDPASFTLQLSAAVDRPGALDFMRKRGLLDRPDADVVRVRSRGREWHVVVVGAMADRASAVAESRRLATRFPDVEPWIRSVKSVLSVRVR